MRMLVLLLLGIVVLGAAQAPRVASEFERVSRDILTAVPEADRGGLASRLERGRAALAAGQLYLALYDLQPVYEGEAGYRLAGQADTFPTQEAFKARWTEMGAPPTPGPTRSKVFFIEALAQSSDGRAPATYLASLPYAEDAGMRGGLYYLAEAHAMVRFAALCRAVDAKPAGPPPTMLPVGPALSAYEAEVVKAYDAAAAPLRPRYAPVHVAIKLARTLDESGRAEGAVLQYLVSRFRYGLIKRDGTALPATADLIARVNATTLPAGADHSIAEFFLQLAGALLTAKEPTPAGAAAILDDIIPAYLELVKK